MNPDAIAELRRQGLGKIADKLEEELAAEEDWTTRYLRAFVTQHPNMLELKEKIRKMSPLNYPVLIQGESGTGKELLAKALHGAREGQFIGINCAGIPENIMESELFGHTKGSFTGAMSDRVGLMKQAENGTLFLDEIGDLSISLQPKLLRAIQEKEVRRIGSNVTDKINCRLVCATHRDLENDWILAGKFREDLYWRISAFIVKPWPLKWRLKDIPLIVKELDRKVSKELNGERESEETIEYFVSRIVPEKLTGNVRTLEHLVIRYKTLGEIP